MHPEEAHKEFYQQWNETKVILDSLLKKFEDDREVKIQLEEVRNKIQLLAVLK